MNLQAHYDLKMGAADPEALGREAHQGGPPPEGA
jgi:hypothetical protein